MDSPESKVAMILGVVVVASFLIATIAIVVVVANANRRGPESVRELASLMNRVDALRLLTVGMIVTAATTLALAKVLDGSSLAAILSGIAGYVLGGKTPRRGYLAPPSPMPISRSKDKPPSH